MVDLHLSLKMTELVGLAAGVTLAWMRLSRPAAMLLFFAASASSFTEVAKSFIAHWPYVPMYQGINQIEALLAFSLFLLSISPRYYKGQSFIFTGLTACVLSLASLLFPKDYYLPNINTGSLWAHVFSWSNSMGRAALIWGAAGAAEAWSRRKAAANNQATPWFMWPAIALSIAFTSLALLSGAVWSLSTIGAPVSFHDPSAIGLLLVWVYLLLISHIRPSGWKRDIRLGIIALGGVIAVAVTLYSDMGVWKAPWGRP